MHYWVGFCLQLWAFTWRVLQERLQLHTAENQSVLGLSLQERLWDAEEGVQRRETKLMKGLEHKSDEEEAEGGVDV